MNGAITDEEKLAALVRAAKTYDHDNRPKYSNWDSVPDHQVARLIQGALWALGPAPERPRTAPGEVEPVDGMTETRQLRSVVREFISMFHGISGGYGARTSVIRLNRLAREAGVEPPRPGQPLSSAVADELAVLQESISHLAAGLRLSASSSHPSKKSQIESGVADALLALLDPR